MYRAVTWRALRDGVDFESDVALEAAAAAIRLEMPADGRVVADGIDVTSDIRSAEVTRKVSRVAAVPGVRREMVRRQKEFAAEGGLVAEGRDMATVVFPDADFKFYLDASPGVRAARRVQEIRERGGVASLEEVEADIRRRDALDSTRKASPLRRAPDTIDVDTTDLGPDGVVQALLEKVVD
jgi:CMP/dCMP kinase